MEIEYIRGHPVPGAKPRQSGGLGTKKAEVRAVTGDSRKEKVKNLQTGKEYLDDAIVRLREAGDYFNRRLDFRVDERTHRIVVKVIDTRTDKVIKEIPPEQLVELAAKIQEMVGLLIDEER
jgi:flagellar protein FlaG